jgi:molybdopterin-guanine dinucleotide biosynthesis protein A
MVGLVLCGGQSSRMGTDKGLIINPKKVTWAQHSFSLLAKLEIPVVISVNNTQYNHYKRIFYGQELIIDSDDLDIQGPLLGLLSAHRKHPSEDIFVLACDMASMDATVLNFLHRHYRQETKKRTSVFTRRNSVEPLCSIYLAKDLEKIYQLHQKGILKNHSLKHCLESLHVDMVDIPEQWDPYFKNYNLPASLAAATW